MWAFAMRKETRRRCLPFLSLRDEGPRLPSAALNLASFGERQINNLLGCVLKPEFCENDFAALSASSFAKFHLMHRTTLQRSRP